MEVIVDEGDFMSYPERTAILKVVRAGGYGSVVASPQLEHACMCLGVNLNSCVSYAQSQMFPVPGQKTAYVTYFPPDEDVYSFVCVLDPGDEPALLRLGLVRASVQGAEQVVFAMPEIASAADREKLCTELRDVIKYQSDADGNTVEHLRIVVERNTAFAWYLHGTLRDFAPAE